MNVAYSEEMSPPKELFSREWFDSSNHLDLLRFRTSRIDETKKKLEELESKLRKKIWKRGGGYKQDLLVDTVTLLNSYIGVWEMRWKIMVSMPSSWETQKIYPKPYTPSRKKIGKNMSKVVLDGVEREGLCLVMLSPQCVEWLNKLRDWCYEVELSNEREMK